MTILKKELLAAAAFCVMSSAASAITLDFDTGTATFTGNSLSDNNTLIMYEQDGFAFSISQTSTSSPNAVGANLFQTDCNGVNLNGQSPSCFGNDDGDLVPQFGDVNGLSGNILIRQDNNPRMSGNDILSDDSAGAGYITFTLLSGPAFNILGFAAVDEQPMQIEVGGDICGPVETGGNGFARVEDCLSPLFVDVGGSFVVRFAGSGGVDNIRLEAVPLPAGLPLLAAGLGCFALLRRRRKS